VEASRAVIYEAVRDVVTPGLWRRAPVDEAGGVLF
jgi:hypothetical protein